MSVNKHSNHLLVLPEDDANHALAHGFQQYMGVAARAMQVLPSAGGWQKVRDDFRTIHSREMLRYEKRHMVLLVDFDAQDDRRARMLEAVPEDLRGRVFILGVKTEPEELRRESRLNLEEVGIRLAAECEGKTEELWNHPLLEHNGAERVRMEPVLRSILFSGP